MVNNEKSLKSGWHMSETGNIYYILKRLELYFLILRLLSRTYKNMFQILIKIGVKSRRRNIYPFTAILKNGNVVDVYSFSQLLILTYGIESSYDLKNDVLQVKYKDRVLQFLGSRDNGEIWRTFGKNDYKFLEFFDTLVLDVGANIGDSSIYFAINGAKRVISIEPFPYTYSYLERNIRINSNEIGGRILAINAGISDENKVVRLGDDYTSGVGSTLLGESSGKGNVEIPVYTLEYVTNKYNLFENIILKMDCEGCEYESILSSSNDTLRKFKQIQIEYHNGPQKLAERLIRAGFDIKIEGLYHVKRKLEHSDLYIGYLYAFQRS